MSDGAVMKMLDNRKARRKKALIHAFASDLKDVYDVKCVIRDVSRTGCRIVSGHLDDLPDTIKLLPEGFSKPVFGKIVWKDDKMAGVRFLTGEGDLEAIAPQPENSSGFLAKMQNFAAKSRRRAILQNDATDRGKRSSGDFIAMMIHELRTPLTAIRGALGLVRAGALGKIPGKVKAAIEVSYRNAGRLTALVNDILDVRKIEAGQMTFDFANLDLCSLAADVVASNQPFADKHGVRFTIDDRLGHAWVNIDAHRIEQALANLLSNAAKFAPKGSDVVLSIAREGGRVRVSVRDSGPGIPADMQQKIFDKFVQVDGADGRGGEGTGLGLSVTRAIVEGHGSAIHLESHPGEGATFSFDLNLIEAPAERFEVPA